MHAPCSFLRCNHTSGFTHRCLPYHTAPSLPLLFQVLEKPKEKSQPKLPFSWWVADVWMPYLRASLLECLRAATALILLCAGRQMWPGELPSSGDTVHKPYVDLPATSQFCVEKPTDCRVECVGRNPKTVVHVRVCSPMTCTMRQCLRRRCWQ